MDDERRIALVDANLIAFARELAGSTPAGALDERRDLPVSILAAAAGFFGRRGHEYGLWTRAHADAALEAVLPSAGFTLEVDLPVMVLETRPPVVPPPAGVEIRQVRDDEGVEDFTIADRAGFADDEQEWAAVDPAFRDPGRLLGPAVTAFVAYVDGVPAAAAMSFTDGGVTRVGWVRTVPAFRRRGLGAAVTRAAVLAGFDRGATIAALEASPVGVGLYRSLGFRQITSYRVWSIG